MKYFTAEGPSGAPSSSAMDTRHAPRAGRRHHGPEKRASGPLALRLLLKRALDVSFAALGLLLVAPVIGLAALALQPGSPGPVLSRQIRCGRHGRHFTLYQLRTRDRGLGQSPDPRAPRSGIARLVHECRIDDLVLLWNVLIGDMSLVGPRPLLPSEQARSGGSGTRRLSMRPGLTCLWQLGERRRLGLEECAKLDLQYVEGWSLRTDFKILAMTFPAALRSASD